METVETSGGTWKYYTKLDEETERPKEIKETMETTGDTYMQIQNCMER